MQSYVHKKHYVWNLQSATRYAIIKATILVGNITRTVEVKYVRSKKDRCTLG